MGGLPRATLHSAMGETQTHDLPITTPTLYHFTIGPHQGQIQGVVGVTSHPLSEREKIYIRRNITHLRLMLL